ncbi:MAG: helix-turn-helix transcriptional regulator [Tistlia sp.]|uniref:helix-turn-helix domain-containing protein n=1 Tax=Tistlia sp. TaxID=3057121 RepID=UPI0034A29F49
MPRTKKSPSRRTPAPAVASGWFARRLAEIGETQRGLARFLGADPSTVSKMLSGVRRIRLEEAEALARFLRVPLLDVLEQAGVSLQGVGETQPAAALVGLVDGEGRIRPWEGEPEAVLLPLAGAPALHHPALVALRLEDPESLMDGWTFFHAPAERVEAGAVGRLAVVRSRGARGERLAVVEAGEAPDRFQLDGFDGRRTTARLASAVPVLLIRP